MDGKALAENAKQFGLELTRTQLEAFALFEKKLYEANASMNLTRVPQEECWSRHFLDSLSISPLIEKGASLLDIGAGAGMPGACIAIARPDITVSVMDSANKEFRFLSSLFGGRGQLPVLYEIILARAEDAAREPSLRESFDFVTGRALAPLAIQGELSAAFVIVGGKFVPMRTPADSSEPFAANKLGLQLIDKTFPVIKPIAATRYLPVYKKTGKTPPEFPRAWAKIKSHPLAD